MWILAPVEYIFHGPSVRESQVEEYTWHLPPDFPSTLLGPVICGRFPQTPLLPAEAVLAHTPHPSKAHSAHPVMNKKLVLGKLENL